MNGAGSYHGFSLNPYNTIGAKPERKTREEFMFGSEPIIGYRIWKIGKPSYDSLGDFLTLLADAHDAGAANPYRHALAQTKRNLLMPIATATGGAWLPGVTESRCMNHGHKAPDLQCECGFWALRDEAQLVRAFESYQPDAWGTVKLWGRFCEFEKGYRAQYAYPSAITLLKKDDALAYDLAGTYGCEVNVGDVPNAVTAAREAAKASFDPSTLEYQPYSGYSYQSLINQQLLAQMNMHASALMPQAFTSGMSKPKRWWQR